MLSAWKCGGLGVGAKLVQIKEVLSSSSIVDILQ